MLPPALSLSLLDLRAPLHAWRPTKSFLSRQLLDHERCSPSMLTISCLTFKVQHKYPSPPLPPRAPQRLNLWSSFFNGDGFYFITAPFTSTPTKKQGWQHRPEERGSPQTRLGRFIVDAKCFWCSKSETPTSGKSPLVPAQDPLAPSSLVHITASALPCPLCSLSLTPPPQNGGRGRFNQRSRGDQTVPTASDDFFGIYIWPLVVGLPFIAVRILDPNFSPPACACNKMQTG